MDRTRIVAILTDFGPDSFYVGIMKAAIHLAAPFSKIVDLTHSIRPHSVLQGSYVLARVFDYFPIGSVFLSVVDPGVGGTRRNIVVEIDGRFFVGPDNGLFTEVVTSTDEYRVIEFADEELKPYRLKKPSGKTFYGRDIFAPAAAAIASGVNPNDLGNNLGKTVTKIEIPAVTVKEGIITGQARYVDSFGNILTSIGKDHVGAAFGDTPYQHVHAFASGRGAGSLRNTYSQVASGELVALLNSWDVVEISENEGRAIDQFSVGPLEGITVELRRTGK